MRRSKLAAGLLLAIASTAQAQDRAYLDGLTQGAIVQERMAHARQMEAEAQLLEHTRTTQAQLAQWMIHAGRDPAEAKAIALAYRITPDEPAIVARARRDGSQATARAINKACGDYNYLLADQLMLGLAMALRDEAAERAQAPDSGGN